MRGKRVLQPQVDVRLSIVTHLKILSDMSAAKRNPPFRAEHVGSLLRPQELVQKRYDVAAGKAQASELVPLEDKLIEQVIKLQKDAGLHVVSSGEYTRYLYTPFLHSVRVESGRQLTSMVLGTCSGAPFSKSSMA